MVGKAYFDNVEDLISHIYHEYGELRPIKLQKTLYFLYALYAGMYSRDEDEDSVLEEKFEMPERLFDAEFEAWTYGPVIRDVYIKKRYKDDYNPKKYNFAENDVDKEVESFIEGLVPIIIKKSDFSLVDRSHEDEAWKNKAGEEDNIMDNREIENEYRKRIEQSRKKQ